MRVLRPVIHAFPMDMLRIILCLLAVAGPVSAQPTAAVSIPASRFVAADTVRAIHRLFARHRRTGGIVAASAVGAAVGAAGVLAATEDTNTSSGTSGGGGYGSLSGPALGPFGFGGFLFINTSIILPLIGYGLEQNIAYGTPREARLVATYEATHRLPANIRRKLRRQLQLAH
jgi:hypothetical protein